MASGIDLDMHPTYILLRGHDGEDVPALTPKRNKDGETSKKRNN